MMPFSFFFFFFEPISKAEDLICELFLKEIVVIDANTRDCVILGSFC